MSIGQMWSSEKSIEMDPETGVRVTRLTGFRANHSHLYFTNNSFYDHNTKIVFNGDRGNADNLFSLNLENGEITQLTDLPALPYPEHYRLYEGIVDPVRNLCYFFAGSTLFKLDLVTLTLTPLYEMPKSFRHHVVSCAYDSDYVYTSIYEWPKDKPLGDLTEIWNAHTLSRILAVRVDGTGVDVIHEEHNFIAHVNVNPKNDKQITFCHEGGWKVIDHRIWGLNTTTGCVWKIHEIPPGDYQGHEYWYQDGVHIGYHGYKADGRRVMGCVAWDNTYNRETAFPYNTGHIYSIDDSLIVGDGNAEGRYIRLWRKTADGYEEGRALCSHNSTFKQQSSHVHPCFTPDGRSVLYTTDRTGYNQVYLAELPEDIGTLPLLSKFSDK